MSSRASLTSPIFKVARTKVDLHTERQLYARAAGRCEFASCNRFLLEHHVTFSPANFAKKAHIVAYSRGGPRGQENDAHAYVNDFSNLMLLCPACHDLIDLDPETYTIDKLKTYKQDHEDRVFRYTELKPGVGTRLLRVTGMVRGQAAVIPDDAVLKALGSNPYDSKAACLIDLNALDDSGPAYWATATHELERKVRGFMEVAGLQNCFQTLSVFAIARIPLLIKLGALLSSKVPIRVFNRQTTTDDWAWTHGTPSNFSYRWLQKGESKEIVVLVSLSGAISLGKLPHELQAVDSILEMTVVDDPPSRTCLRTEQSLHNFRECYASVLQEVRAFKPEIIHLVPAIPTAGAVHLGRDILPTFDPPMKIYDWNGSDGYICSLTVNNHD
ncbi:MAG: SAVED domain-containing protein [Fimbriimonadales bacterium]